MIILAVPMPDPSSILPFEVAAAAAYIGVVKEVVEAVPYAVVAEVVGVEAIAAAVAAEEVVVLVAVSCKPSQVVAYSRLQ